MDSRLKGALRALPKRSQNSLPFCENHGSKPPAAIDSWLAELSQKDTKEQGQQLNNALGDFLVYACNPKELLQLAEKVRPVIINCCETLTKKHLTNSVVFDSGQQACFDICALLHNSITLLYRSIAEDPENNKQGQAFSLHRAMSHSTQSMLFYSLLYRPVPPGFWLEQHHLFKLAQRLKLTEHTQPDSFNKKALNIVTLYKRSLLLSRSRANKLNYDDIKRVWQALALWAPHSKLKKTSGLQTFFAINLSSDDGLHYASPDPDREIKGVFGLDCRILSAHLKKLKETPDQSGSISPQLINHLASAWAQISKRQHSRAKNNDHCQVSSGFSPVHYHLSGEMDFNSIVAPFAETEATQKQSFDAEKNDVWANAYDAGEDKERSQAQTEENAVIQFNSQPAKKDSRYQPDECQLINISDGGYCVEMSLPVSQKINIGDPAAIKMNGGESWALAVVRWVEIVSAKKLRLGLEKLSSQVEPCAISLIHKTQGVTSFQRGFMLPDQPAIGQHATLIMSGLTAKPGMKFKLLHKDVVKKGQLDKCISQTSVYCEFQYRLFGQ